MASQPIIRGIQTVGSITVLYRYNNPVSETVDGAATTVYKLPIPTSVDLGSTVKYIDAKMLYVAGFRLDGEFLNAQQQVASSSVIPILGGGGVALTNNNRTGTVTFTCTKVSTPTTTTDGAAPMQSGSSSSLLGVVDTTTNYYDMVLLAQIQQGQEGGDSVGSTICICYEFNGVLTQVQFEGCTIADIKPIILAGNDAANYAIQVNYLNWKMAVNASSVGFISD